VAVVAMAGLLTLAATKGTDTAESTQTAPKTGVKALGLPSTTSSTPSSSTTTSSTTTTSAPPPAPPAPPAPDILADPAVTAYLAGRPGTVTAAVADLNTGLLSQYRPGQLVGTASVVKVDILEALLHQAEVQGRSLTPAEQREATAMIDESDNDAATDLWDEVGAGGGVVAYNATLLLGATAPDASGSWGLTTTTAADQVTLLRALVDPTSPLDAASRNFQLTLMGQVDTAQTWGVTAGLEPGTAVQLKNGWLPVAGGWLVNSEGLVTGGGRHYAIAVLTSGDPTQQAGEDTIAGLSALVWQLLAPKPPPARLPASVF
jgi:beta-lactamase class A